MLLPLVPFRWLARSLGRPMTDPASAIRPADLRRALKIGWAVRCAAEHTPWKSVCLPQSMAGQWMLKRRGIAGTVFLGARCTEGRPGLLAAHAWLRCGGLVLTGARGHQAFTVMARFS
jgi:hypothetical protein